MTSSPWIFSIWFPGFGFPPVPYLIVVPQSGHVAILVNIFNSSIHTVKCYKGVKKFKWQAFVTKLQFSRTMLLSQSHFDHRCHPVFDKIMNYKLFRVLYIDIYTPTSSLCYMVLLETFPTYFLGEVQFFFSGLMVGPTYRPPVRHSDPDTPLGLVQYISSQSFRHVITRFFFPQLSSSSLTLSWALRARLIGGWTNQLAPGPGF